MSQPEEYDEGQRDRVITRVSLAVIALAMVLGAFYFGGRMRASAETVRTPSTAVVAPSRTATPSPTPSPTPTKGPIAAGVHPWTALLGTECLNPYTSPWQTTYTVVACSTLHAGQMTRRVTLKGDTYPGSATLIASLSLTCSGGKAVDLSAATKYSDIRFAFSYPTAAEWEAGDRHGYCFVSRADGTLLTASVAG